MTDMPRQHNDSFFFRLYCIVLRPDLPIFDAGLLTFSLHDSSPEMVAVAEIAVRDRVQILCLVRVQFHIVHAVAFPRPSHGGRRQCDNSQVI
ncbi:unnamed protein product [Ilex paraguariensis]|uniref:Uncharacterized protein n=1 Tax=Ilex paraguariensis TaxID=185542 RepID=A0ABC8QZJ4_9AQUA